jgi:hypothetical protein
MKKIMLLLFAGTLFLQNGFSQVSYNGYLIGQSPNSSAVKFQFTNDTSTSYVTGNMAIGSTTVPDSFMFAVNGAGIFTKVRVKLFSNWPDYVFEDTYTLPALTEVEKYLKQNKHLPDIASEAEVKKDGIDLGSNQAALLQKIEELTLYIIEQDKKTNEQTEQIKELQQQNQQFQKELDELKKLITANK